MYISFAQGFPLMQVAAQVSDQFHVSHTHAQEGTQHPRAKTREREKKI